MGIAAFCPYVDIFTAFLTSPLFSPQKVTKMNGLCSLLQHFIVDFSLHNPWCGFSVGPFARKELLLVHQTQERARFIIYLNIHLCTTIM